MPLLFKIKLIHKICNSVKNELIFTNLIIDNYNMDNIDQIILGLLKDNARMSVTELAEKFTFHGQRSKRESNIWSLRASLPDIRYGLNPMQNGMSSVHG